MAPKKDAPETPKAAAPLDEDFRALSPEMKDELLSRLLAEHRKGGDGSSRELVSVLGALSDSMKKQSDELARQVRRQNSTNLDDRDPFAFDSRCQYCKAQTPHPDTKALKHPKPKLRYDVFFCQGRQTQDMLTPLEVELFNSFDTSRECRGGKWRAELKPHGTRTRLFVSVPFEGMDVRMDLPPLVQILSELLYGEMVADPAQALAMISALQRRVDELEANRAPA
jgi:hypothetical protein